MNEIITIPKKSIIIFEHLKADGYGDIILGIKIAYHIKKIHKTVKIYHNADENVTKNKIKKLYPKMKTYNNDEIDDILLFNNDKKFIIQTGAPNFKSYFEDILDNVIVIYIDEYNGHKLKQKKRLLGG